jgi:hypothetical protein
MRNMNEIACMVGITNENQTIPLGSCFLLPKEGYFVTCRHVIGNFTDKLVIILPPNNINDYQDVSNTQCRIIPAIISDINPINDIAILKSGNNINIKSNIELGSVDEIFVGDSIEIWGYPHCSKDASMHILTAQQTLIGAKIIKESESIKFKYAILNIQTRPGQSGSLVYCERINKIIGILIGGYAPESGIRLGDINPQELNQTSFCLSAEYIIEML